jgi:hypothetical protein
MGRFLALEEIGWYRGLLTDFSQRLELPQKD